MKRLACIFSAFLLWNCSEHVAGGPGSETTNGIAYVGDGAVASYASVAVRSVDYKPSVDSATNALVNADFYADADGRFSFEAPEGEYRLTIVHGGSAYTGLYKTKGDTSIGSINLEPTASLGGLANVPKKCDFVWVGVRGMDVLVRSDSAGRFQLSQLPSNDSLQVYFLRGDNNKVYDDLSVKLEPNESEIVNLQPDTLKNKIKFFAVADGEVVPFAALAIRKADARPDSLRVNNTVVEADAYADKNGMFAIDSLKSGNYRLTVTQSGLAYSKVLSAKEIAKLDTVKLTETANYMSRVTLYAGDSYAWVGVYGLDVMTKTNAEGVFSLPMLPSKDSLDIYVVSKKDSLYAKKRVVLSGGSADFDYPSVVLQDFEKDTANWYFNVDAIGSKVLSKAFETDKDRKSKVFHGKYSLIANNNYDAWVVTGSMLRGEGFNLSSLDSISFYAKGSGQIRVSLEKWDSLAEAVGTSLKAASEWMNLNTSKWTHFVVKIEDLCYNSNDDKSCYTTWNSLKDAVRQLNFFVRNGTEFYLDDITLYGAYF
ncbi:MAG: carboxypeptidase regulatory-like domain-containing protein [Fibrobacter sp.]|nr:carboxypeptidase regulatory-like domain-containing protein [Fibrobacter sp.]